MRWLVLLLLLTSPAAAERVLRVGPGEAFAVPSQAAAAARAGDRVLIAPGLYRDCATWRTPGLHIAADGGAVEITGPVCGDKALFVVAAPAITIEGLTFRGAVATPGNGAGIRAEGGDLVVRRSRFEGNQNGILTASGMTSATLLVEDSVFLGNGFLREDCAHGLYAGDIALVTIRRSRFEATRVCHHVKSRARRTEIIDTLIADADPGQASYLVDIPNGGDLLIRGSELRKGPRSGNPRAAVVVGAEGVTQPTVSLVVEGTRFVNLMPRPTTFLRNFSTSPAALRGNAFEGLVVALEGPGRAR